MMSKKPTYEELEQRVRILGKVESELKKAREQEAHIRKVLLAIRNVNQLIVKETDPGQLIKRACASLTETRGYFNAWIALMDEAGSSVTMTASSGFDGGFVSMKSHLLHGEFPSCMRETLGEDKLVVTRKPTEDCHDCPLSSEYAGRAGLSRRLSHAGKLYGILSVSVPKAYAYDVEEHDLFTEVTDDLGFALHKMETEEQAHRLNSIITSIPQPMSLVSPQYRYLAVNDVYAELYSTSPENIIGHTPADFLGDHIFETEIKPHLDQALNGRQVRYEIESVFTGIGPRWMAMSYFPYRDKRGDIKCVISHGDDITERKQAEEALREKTKFLHSIFETTSDLVSVTDMEGNFKFIGPSHSILGYDPDSLVGRNVMELVHPDDYRKIATAFADSLANREDGRMAEYRYRRADGDYLWLETVGKFILDDAGNPKEILFTSRDVTARKRAEGELKRIEWMLSRKPGSNIEAQTEAHDQGYGDLTELNRDGIILKSIGHEHLTSFADDYLELLGTSSAIYEVNGDYAFGIFASGWCRMMDSASRKLCNTPDNVEALNSGRWLCHESCWTDCSKEAIAKRAPVDIECKGGIRLYAVPIFASGNVIGAINFGYGDPPKDPEKLKMLADVYQLNHDDLLREATVYDSRPHYIIEMAKKRLNSTATLIGSMVETKQAMKALRESEEKHRRLFDTMAQGVIYQATDGAIISANPAAERILGLSFDQMRGKTSMDPSWKMIREDGSTVPGEEHPAMVALRTGRIIGPVLRGVFNPDKNTHIWLSIIAIPLFQPGENAPFQAYAAFEDITERKMAEEALVESEFRFRSFVENANDIVYSLNPEGMFTYVSPNWLDAMGEPANEAVGKSFEPYVHAEDVHLCREFLERVLSTGKKQSSVEYRVRHSNGSWRWHVSNGSPLWDSNGAISGYLGIARDITEQKDREIEYAQVLKTAIDGFWLIDMEGRLVEVNDAAAALLRYSPEEMTRLTISDIDAKESPDKTQGRIQQLLKEGSARFETRHKRKDGGLIDVEVSVSFSPMGGGRMVAFTRDITERKRAEREERLNKARLEIIHKIATMPEASEGDLCDFVLESMLELTDSAIAFLGFMTEDAEVMQIHAWSSSAMAECAIHDKPIEFRIAKAGLWGEPLRNRAPIIVNDYGQPHPAKKGRPEGHIDISRFMAVPVFEGDRIAAIGAVGNREMPYEEADSRQLMLLMDSWWEQVRRKREIREKEALQTRLQQAQKMESIGTLAGGIAHDFNNILSIIVGNTELAMLDLPDWTPAQDNLKEVREATLRARDLVKQILMFARQKEHTVSNISLEPIAKESIKMLRASIPTTVKIHTKIKKGLPSVLADPSQIQQIIINLCTNAGQVMEAEGGTLTFTLDSVELDTQFVTVAGALPPGQYVRMQVKDTGPGIPPEMLDRIFDPFFTTKGVGEGTGLGLAVVHGIVQDRKGGITVESEEGRGTTFSIYLPASEVESVEVKAEQEMELPRGTERILFVDDEPMIMKLGQHMLEHQGYTVETRVSGTDALECFKQDPHRFALVVTDMTMPGMRGDRLAEEILAIRSDIPVILCTGYSRQISKEKAREIGVSAFVMKPLTQHELANTVRRVLDQKSRK